MENFSDVAKSAWITDDGKTTFCVPMASVIHGFIYNKDAFDKLGLKPPKTMDEFMAVLDKIKKDGTYIPLAMGTADQWEAATMGFQNIGPNYWKGEEGRLALIAGKQKFTDPPYVDTFKALATWKPYMPPGFEAQKYPDSQNLFTLGRAAIYPAGSWEISLFNTAGQVQDGRLPAAGAQGRRHLLHQRPHRHRHGPERRQQAPGRGAQDLPRHGWPRRSSPRSTPTRCPASSRLSNSKVDVQDPLAQEFLGWREHQQVDHPQLVPDPLARHAEPGERAVAAERRGDQRHHDAEQAGQEAQDGLDKWYKPKTN